MRDTPIPFDEFMAMWENVSGFKDPLLAVYKHPFFPYAPLSSHMQTGVDGKCHGSHKQAKEAAYQTYLKRFNK